MRMAPAAEPGPPASTKRVITSFTPPSSKVTGAPILVVINGQNFVSTDKVLLAGGAAPTTFLSATQLRFTIGAEYETAMNYAVVVVVAPNYLTSDADASALVYYPLTPGS